jgi:DNA mismatch repair protein MutS2
VLDEASTTGEVLEIDGDEAVISLGSMRLRTDVGRLRKVGGKQRQQARVGRIEQGVGGISSLSAQRRIDLRGFRVDEAIDAVMRLIDDALAANLDNLEILHGTGTGALRQAIHSYLAERKEVIGFSEAPLNQGGAGVTRVMLT